MNQAHSPKVELVDRAAAFFEVHEWSDTLRRLAARFGIASKAQARANLATLDGSRLLELLAQLNVLEEVQGGIEARVPDDELLRRLEESAEHPRPVSGVSFLSDQDAHAAWFAEQPLNELRQFVSNYLQGANQKLLRAALRSLGWDGTWQEWIRSASDNQIHAFMASYSYIYGTKIWRVQGPRQSLAS